MNSGDAIVKRRPSRTQLNPEPLDDTHTTEVNHPQEEHRHYVVDMQHEEEGTAAAATHHDDDKAAEETVPSRHNCAPYGNDQHASPPLDSDDEEGTSTSLAQEEDAAVAPNDGVASADAAPPRLMKTSRPHGAKTKTATKTKEKVAKREADGSAIAVVKPAAPKKKKPTHRVSLANVEKQAPVPEGVNTPRSISVCKKNSVNPAELAPYPKEHFQGTGVADELAELRYHSYEKRRQSRMAQLMPAYRAAAQEDSTPCAQRQADPNAALEHSTEPAGAQRPMMQSSDEEEKMQRQFDLQRQRLLEQERRKASTGNDYDGYRRASAPASHPRGTSPGRYSASTISLGRCIIDQPYSAAKIYSHSITEERPLTQSEATMIENINEREARRLDTQERATIIQENKELLRVERELEKERRSSANVQAKAYERERIQQEHFKHSKDRYLEVAARRQRLDKERQSKLMENIAEKGGHTHANDPYAPLLSRRRESTSLARRSSSNYSASQQGQPTEVHEVAAEAP